MTHYTLKQLSASIAIVFTTLLVGCGGGSSSSTSITNSGNSVPPLSSLTLDIFLNDIPSEIRTQANIISDPTQSYTSVITQSSSRNSGASSSVEALMAEVIDIDNNRPRYRITYQRLPSNGAGSALSTFEIISHNPLLTAQHVALTSRTGLNLKLTAIDYDVSGPGIIDGRFYLEIYTNHSEHRKDTSKAPFGASNYLAMGNWLFIPETRTQLDEYSIGSFVNGEDIVTAAEIQSITGEATYKGAAYGFVLLHGQDNAEVLPLQADVLLTATFGSTDTIDGGINNFQIRRGTGHGSSATFESGEITLSSGAIDASVGGFASTARGATGTLRFTTSAGTVMRTHAYTGTWNSNFYGHVENSQPDRVAGTVAGFNRIDTARESALHLVFGAYKD